MSIVMLLVYSMFILASSPCFHLTTKSLLFDYWIIFLEPIVQGRNNVWVFFFSYRNLLYTFWAIRNPHFFKRLCLKLFLFPCVVVE